MKFKKATTGVYTATRKDGIEITIELTDYSGDMSWKSSRTEDFNGDHIGFYSTKSEAVAQENNEEAFL